MLCITKKNRILDKFGRGQLATPYFYQMEFRANLFKDIQLLPCAYRKMAQIIFQARAVAKMRLSSLNIHGQSKEIVLGKIPSKEHLKVTKPTCAPKSLNILAKVFVLARIQSF